MRTILMQKMFSLLLPLLFLSMLSGCAVTNKFGPYMGKVVDAETKEPIEGAVVFMEVTTVTGTLAGAAHHYAGFQEALTDGNGEFHIELRVTAIKPGHVWEPYPNLYVFKPGYGVFPDHRGTNSDILVRNTSHILPENTNVIITLPKLKTRKERASNLDDVSIAYKSKIPFEKRQDIFRLKNIERVQLGFESISKPR